MYLNFCSYPREKQITIIRICCHEKNLLTKKLLSSEYLQRPSTTSNCKCQVITLLLLYLDLLQVPYTLKFLWYVYSAVKPLYALRP